MRRLARSPLWLVLIPVLLSGCWLNILPYGDYTPNPATSSLKLALVITDGTRESVEQTHKEGLTGSLGKLYGPLITTMPFDKITSTLRRDFRSVTLVDTVEQAREIEADVMGVLDIYARYSQIGKARMVLCYMTPIPPLIVVASGWKWTLGCVNSVEVNVTMTLMDLDQTQLEVVRIEEKKNSGKSLVQYVPYISEQVRISFQKALAGSRALAELGAAKNAHERELLAELQRGGGRAGGKARLRSSVDRPSYRTRRRRDDYALVIGIEDYADVPDAQYAERDAEAVRRHFLALGVPEGNLVHLAGEKAGRAAFEKYFESWLPGRVGPRSRVYVYFSGHGAPDPETGSAYLVPWDGDPKFLKNTAYPLKRFYDKLGALKAREVIVAMDACFSGAGGRSVLAEGTRPLVMSTKKGAVPRGKLVVFSAAGPNEITGAHDKSGHGLFTYYFLRALNKWKGKPTVKGVFNYLRPRVQAQARRKNREQNPQLMPAKLGRKGRIRFRPLK